MIILFSHDRDENSQIETEEINISLRKKTFPFLRIFFGRIGQPQTYILSIFNCALNN